MKTTFNTGRHYGPEGQVIHAEYRDGMVYFYDRTRMIDGRFAAYATFYDQAQLERLVMRHYDENRYEACAATWAFANQCMKEEA